ncbi:MAG: transposase [Candidatus Thorarchaeota archaeon]|jgi:hypothetical protein
MNELQILKQNPKKVLESLNLGEIERMELAVEQITDEFMIYGLRGGLIDELSVSFPDPRKECEITVKQILSASIAGHFQDMYAMSQSPYALHSPTLLAELGLNVKVLCEGDGISRRGTNDNAPFSGDVTRKLLNGMELSELVDWYNQSVGKAYLRQANYEPTLHILDCTELEVNLENENYEGSGIVRRKKKRKDGKQEEEVKRGYKLGSLRSLLDDGGIITAIAFGSINIHDLTLCRDLLMTTPHLKPGDMLIVDRAYIDGETISRLKKERKVDVTIPLRSDMKAYEDSLITAYDPNTGSWEQHPTRENQEIKRIERVDWMWDECSVPMDGCVVRELKEGKDGSSGRDTRLDLTGKRMIQTYELRSEIEEDHRQWKNGLWDMGKFTSTSLVQIVYHVICVLLSYNLCEIYSNTQSGQKFADKTLRQLRRQQARNHDAAMVVYAGAYFAVFNIKYLMWLLLDAPKDIQERLKPHFMSGFT